MAQVKEMPSKVFLSDISSIAAIQDIEIRTKFVPQWDSHIYMRVPSAAQKGVFEQSVADRENRDISTLKIRLCGMVMCDQDGKLLFESPEKAVEVLSGKSSGAIEVIAEEALKMIQITDQELEDAAKN